MAEQPNVVNPQLQLTKDQIMDILKKIVVYVDVSENAVFISTKKLLSYFLANTKELDKIIKVDIDDNKEVIVYASAKPTKPGIKSIIMKVTLDSSAFILGNFKYELVKAGDDVHIKIYVQQDILPNSSNTNTNNEIDF
ncbi:MAG: hypothetical protein JHC33_08420 [Ignisphaera sp.]|nr:hypothetical protein [Ignisphaera sp.]